LCGSLQDANTTVKLEYILQFNIGWWVRQYTISYSCSLLISWQITYMSYTENAYE